ncbi:MAG TPA: hypothetical protein PKD09_10710 [Aggregatilinea sp.]|uniref:hypothetical protein n=1 Tax=Aggregatilinea sp. TaxID=2806333 RepID=UPI002C0E0610|nr:hypothetical protein [Aggregatilinea sp.]HML22114.1 hypothetical protein [Aggregatilinea sp.]
MRAYRVWVKWLGLLLALRALIVGLAALVEKHGGIGPALTGFVADWFALLTGWDIADRLAGSDAVIEGLVWLALAGLFVATLVGEVWLLRAAGGWMAAGLMWLEMRGLDVRRSRLTAPSYPDGDSRENYRPFEALENRGKRD